MKKILIFLLIYLGLLCPTSFASSEYSLAATLDLGGLKRVLYLHLEATLLPIDGLGVRASTELGIGNNFPTRTSVDILFFTPTSIYIGGGLSLLTDNSFSTIQFGVFVTIGYDLLLYNSISLFIETRPTYLVDALGTEQFVIPVSFGFRLRYNTL